MMEDGSVRRVRSRGDEFFNWVEEEKGYAVARGENGRWQYATRAKGRWVAAGMTPRQTGREGRVSDPPLRTSPFAAVAEDGSTAVEALAVGPAMAMAVAPAPAKLCVILVAFADRGFTYSSDVWTNTFFGGSGRSVNTYYRQASKNRFWFNPAEETEGTANDGVISVTLASNHPNTASTDDTVRTAVKQALIAADPFINYQTFDTDGNGTLSSSELHLVLVFAGYEYAYSASYMPYIWAHRWSLFSPVTAPLLDGVSVGSTSGGYMAVGEIHFSHAATIGVICHELGHNLGWPDLYDTDGSSDGVGTHCLMGNGNWGKALGESYQGTTPVLPSAYCRWASGFSDAQKAVGAGVSYTLPAISEDSNTTDMVYLATPNSQQYYLVENRQLAGYDSGLYQYLGVSSGGGLAIWHIDTSVAGNTIDTRRRVDLEEAASPVLDVPGSYYGRLQNYYYAGNVTRFDETTVPDNTLNGGVASLARVFNVSASGAQMSFTADEGVSLESAVDVGESQVVASGSPAWINQTSVTHDGSDAARSGTVSKSARTSWMSTVVTGPVQVAFWWKHAAGATETLRFLVDGVEQAATGVADWTQQSHSVSGGVHTVQWNLYTDMNANGTANQAYVDQLVLTPVVVGLAVDAPALSFPWQGGMAQLALRNTGSAAMLWQTEAPAWCSLVPASGTLTAGATQEVSVVCATNLSWQAARSGSVTLSGTDPFGFPAMGSPVVLTVSQQIHPPPNPATIFSVR
jgi:M6 family metalloprotease-like protein